MSIMRCERCGRFIGPESCSEGWSGGLFGDYNGIFYCAAYVGCNADGESDENSTLEMVKRLTFDLRLLAS